ncbi:MAG: hypothetical protein ABII18_11745 [bacterium]|nr:hypothetical protein [bacterium]
MSTISPALPVTPMQAFGISCEGMDIPFLMPTRTGDGFHATTRQPTMFFEPPVLEKQERVWQACINKMAGNNHFPLTFDEGPFHTRWFLEEAVQHPKSFTLTGITYEPNPNDRLSLRAAMVARHRYELGNKPRVERTESDDQNARMITTNSKKADAVVQTMLVSVHKLHESLVELRRPWNLLDILVDRNHPADVVLRRFFERQVNLYQEPSLGVADVRIEKVTPHADEKAIRGLTEFTVTLLSETGSDMLAISCEVYLGGMEKPHVRIHAELTHEQAQKLTSLEGLAMIALLTATNPQMDYIHAEYPRQDKIPLPDRTSPLTQWQKLLS